MVMKPANFVILHPNGVLVLQFVLAQSISRESAKNNTFSVLISRQITHLGQF